MSKLTFGFPNGEQNRHINRENHGTNDHSRECRSGNISKIRRQKGTSSQNNQTRDASRQNGGVDTRRRIDGRASEGTGDGQSPNERPDKLAHTKCHDFFRGIHFAGGG